MGTLCDASGNTALQIGLFHGRLSEPGNYRFPFTLDLKTRQSSVSFSIFLIFFLYIYLETYYIISRAIVFPISETTDITSPPFSLTPFIVFIPPCQFTFFIVFYVIVFLPERFFSPFQQNKQENRLTIFIFPLFPPSSLKIAAATHLLYTVYCPTHVTVYRYVRYSGLCDSFLPYGRRHSASLCCAFLESSLLSIVFFFSSLPYSVSVITFFFFSC